MKNWIRAQNGHLINLDYISHIYPREIKSELQENAGEVVAKWFIVGEIAGKEAGYLISDGYDNEADAMSFLSNLNFS